MKKEEDWKLLRYNHKMIYMYIQCRYEWVLYSALGLGENKNWIEIFLKFSLPFCVDADISKKVFGSDFGHKE